MVVWLPAYAELERLADTSHPDETERLMVQKILLHYLAIGADCKELTATAGAVLETGRQLAAVVAGGPASGFSLVLVRSATIALRQLASDTAGSRRSRTRSLGQPVVGPGLIGTGGHTRRDFGLRNPDLGHNATQCG